MKNAAAKQIEFGAAVRLPLQQFQPVNLALDRTIAPRLRQGGPNRRKIAGNSGNEAVQCCGSCRRQPGLKRGRIPLAQNAAEFIDYRRRGADLGRESSQRIDKLSIGLRQLLGGRGEQACRASARGYAPGRQWQLSVCTGGIKAAAPDGPPPDDVVSAIEPLIVQLAPQLGTVVAPLSPASLHIPKMPIERTRSRSAAIYRRLAGAQPAAHGVTRYAQAPRNTADRHARSVQPSHLFIARLPLLAPLRPLPVALRGRLLLACRRHRHDSR